MTTIMLNVDKELKKDFSDCAKKLGTNSSNLIRMFMSHTINTKRVSFEMEHALDFEIEPLDISNWSPENIQKAEEITKKLEKIFCKQKRKGKCC